MKVPTSPSLLTTALFTAAILTAATTGFELLDADHYLADIRYLASPELKGRATGSPELEKAARYIAKHFKDDRLHPIEGDNYLQPFSVTTSAKLGKACAFASTSNGRVRIALRLQSRTSSRSTSPPGANGMEASSSPATVSPHPNTTTTTTPNWT